MKRNIFFVLTVVLLAIFCSNVSAVPELKLPFRGGETWWVSYGNSSCETAEECTHYVGSRQEYAWDFN
jgi:hypothetical protein